MKNMIRISGIAVLLLSWLVVVNTLMDVVLSTEKLDPGTGGPSLALIATGREIFELKAGGVGCASCHGIGALGDIDIGPNIRGVTEDTVRNALASVEVMDFLNGQLTDDDIHAVVAYLQFLGTISYAKAIRKSGDFDPAELHIPVGSQVQIIISNSDRTPCTFTSLDDSFESKTIAGKKSDDFIWVTPKTPATFKASCQEKPEKILTMISEEPQPPSGGE